MGTRTSLVNRSNITNGAFARGLAGQVRNLSGPAAIDSDDRQPRTPPPRQRQPAANRPDAANDVDEVDSETGLPISEAEKDRRRRKKQEEQGDRSRDSAERGANTESPGSEPGAIGPMGDGSNNVGYRQARADAKKFQKAFGTQGLEWFAQGKTFAQAQALFNEQKRQTSTRTLRQNGLTGGMAKFARGTAKQIRGKK